MDEADKLATLRHDVANPLAALLAEVQLLLMESGKLAPEVVTSLKTIETQALKIRTWLRTA